MEIVLPWQIDTEEKFRMCLRWNRRVQWSKKPLEIVSSDTATFHMGNGHRLFVARHPDSGRYLVNHLILTDRMAYEMRGGNYHYEDGRVLTVRESAIYEGYSPVRDLIQNVSLLKVPARILPVWLAIESEKDAHLFLPSEANKLTRAIRNVSREIVQKMRNREPIESYQSTRRMNPVRHYHF